MSRSPDEYKEGKRPYVDRVTDRGTEEDRSKKCMKLRDGFTRDTVIPFEI